MAEHLHNLEETFPLDPSMSDSLVGREMGDFHIVREVGRGGMGTVYLSRQKSLDRMVALKVLSRGLSLTSLSIQRFQREAQAAAKLHHKNIVPIYAQGEYSGIHYYAMEFVPGENLHDSITRHRISQGLPSPVSEGGSSSESGDSSAETIVLPRHCEREKPDRKAASTLGRSEMELSEASMAHFESIARMTAEVADALEYAHEKGVIHRDVKPHNVILGEDGRIYILDFGLARVLEHPGVTATGEFVGSPLYMSPEQIVGDRGNVDKRTDIYSLGATLYEWLTLKPPFPGDSREYIISKIISSEPVPPRSLNPKVPVDLETICLKALEKDRNKRYDSAGQMRDDLIRFLERRSITARRAGALTRGWKFVLRHKVASVVSVALFVGAVLIGALLQQAKEAKDSKARVETASQVIREQKENFDQKAEQIDQLMSFMTMGESLGEQMGPALASVPVAGELLKWDFEFDAPAEDLARQLSKALRLARRAHESRGHQTTLGPAQGAARALYERALALNDPKEARKWVDKCLELAADYLPAVKLSAIIYGEQGEYARMLEIAEAVSRENPKDQEAMLLLGVARYVAGEVEQGIADIELISHAEATSSWPFAMRGLISLHTSDPAEAARHFGTALALDENNPVALLERARINAEQGLFRAAIADTERVIDLLPGNADAYALRGDCYYALQQPEKAADDYGTAFALGRSVKTLFKLGMATTSREERLRRLQLQEEPESAEVPEQAENPPQQEETPTDQI